MIRCEDTKRILYFMSRIKNSNIKKNILCLFRHIEAAAFKEKKQTIFPITICCEKDWNDRLLYETESDKACLHDFMRCFGYTGTIIITKDEQQFSVDNNYLTKYKILEITVSW